LESIGVLAGGIAHDFNNILTAIFGNVSLIRLHASSYPAIVPLLDQVDKGFFRAGDLTQQLLTFAKGGAPIKRVGSLRDLIEDTTRFLLHGTKVAVEFFWCDNFWVAEFDAGQMSQAISNIVLNAVQAMPGGGVVRVTGTNVTLGHDEVPLLAAGQYVRVSIQDEGPGIPEGDRGRIFHPYFTTKSSGTGLGLATTYSILGRHGGQVVVGGVVGKGAIFDVYLPATYVSIAAESREGRIMRHGAGYVIVMDDEEPVRKVCSEILTHLGYEVEIVADGASLVALYGERLAQGRRPHAVIVDLTIPGGMDGREAAQRILAIDHAARLLVSSGYCTDPVVSNYENYGFVGVVPKPYDIPEIAAVLARVTGGHEGDRR
jgi:CheY-like chemotaxis protein